MKKLTAHWFYLIHGMAFFCLSGFLGHYLHAQSPVMQRNDVPRHGITDRELLDTVDNISVDYVTRCLTIQRYLVVSKLAYEAYVDDLASIQDTQIIFAVERKPGNYLLRSEHLGTLSTTQFEEPTSINERKLVFENHHYIERYGSIHDVYGRDPEKNPFTDAYCLDPLTLPLDYSGVIRTGRDDVNALHVMMPAGKLFAAAKTPSGKFVGWWWHGAEERLGYTQVVFDPEVDHLPVEFRIYIRSSDKEMTADNLADTTAPYQTTLTRWAKHPSETFVPVEVVCQQFRPYQTGWRAQMRWWLGEQVPDAIFTLEDFQRSRARASLLQELTKQITEESATATDSSGS